ncbi:hypothetical protein [Flavobacterium hercynium]|uniref:DUF3857 domain-containing protein n=1 Tax=Flavobacterium hercynium TaxID=387094 RepID=A0A226HIZ8_9FLAO|nr:hypothetical protein [Flavobacterium hercynium]OXA94094.1 hypothetical protein B0A66_05285 [Flavobacterium hercynium]SMP33122.1 hypothetical protein SAMN06265346_11631 [Flavobacterium hercynium]
MKKLLTTLLLSYSLMVCAQKKQINKEDIMNEESIKKVTNIYNQVKRYKYNPSYTLHIEKAANFTFEVLVNDYPMFIEYNPHVMSGSKPINHAILKPGKQKLTIRMTPPVDKEYNMGHEIDMENITLKLSINYGEYVLQKVSEFKEALRYELPQQKGKLPYYEVNLEFDAIAPYQNDIEGWQNGVDLTKEDKDKLLKEVEDFYKELIKYYDAKDVNALASKYYKRQFEIAQSHYQTKIYDSQIVVDAWMKNVNDTKPFIFNQYVMRFFGNGKMVALVKTDKYYINYSSLMREDAKGNYTYYGLMLHRPKPGAPLEVIR